MVNSPLIKVVIFDIETYTRAPFTLSYAASTVIEDLLRFFTRLLPFCQQHPPSADRVRRTDSY